jgi:hypothetical protein
MKLSSATMADSKQDLSEVTSKNIMAKLEEFWSMKAAE